MAEQHDREKILKQYYKDAPTIAGPWMIKQINKLNGKIQTLRMDYKSAETPEKKKQIQIEGEEVKAEIELYKSITGATQNKESGGGIASGQAKETAGILGKTE